MVNARLQFDRHRFPSAEQTFGFFFRPILPRLRAFYWICDHWPLRYPCSDDASFALQFVEDGITPPDTVLPAFAHEIIGDRDAFFAVRAPPDSAADFNNARFAAAARDQNEWGSFVPPPLDSPRFRLGQQRYAEHVAQHGTHLDRFLEQYPVEYAFLTNDGVWWVATREEQAMDELRRHASEVRGMSFNRTPAFAM